MSESYIQQNTRYTFKDFLTRPLVIQGTYLVEEIVKAQYIHILQTDVSI